MTDWKPGDVAVLSNHQGTPAIRVERSCGDPSHDYAETDHWHYFRSVGGATWDSNGDREGRRLVVIDPEDREQVERLRDEFDLQVIRQNDDPDPRDVTPVQRGNALQAALRVFAAPSPPRPEVYEHVASYEPGRSGITTSLCGKTWKTGADVTVVGKCPDCLDIVARWVA